jgi:hypothetical protein
MYRVIDTDPSSYYRVPLGPELVTACPTCERPKGVACVIALWRVGEKPENTELPHNRRYIAAKMDPYATADAA